MLWPTCPHACLHERTPLGDTPCCTAVLLQTYEGGLGGEPGNEAHGGYTFCGLAALKLAGQPEVLDLPRLLHWAAQRQGWVEGGFNGRTNKLVDGCYSFWQGGVFPLLQQLLATGEQHRQQQQVPAVSRSSPTYPPLTPPSSWQQQEQQPQQQCSQEIVVPPLPDLSRVQGPQQQAQLDAERLNEVSDALTEAVLGSSAEASTLADAASSLDGNGGPGPRSAAAYRQLYLQKAQAAQQAAEYADEMAAIAAASAAVLYPCTSTAAASSGSRGDAAAAAAPAAPAAPAGCSSSGDDQDVTANPLFNTRALQCWILRACQQLKGGLRDKPGKSADYYHTCYCLSGLSMAQHIPGGGVVGAASNRLKQADPLVNIVVNKLQEATAYFSSLQ
eukprot:GHRR01026293.1.p1 GENE.GHRR01026293.1~~GHRR01026293.1.p1  ORF type:complete len:388 (+),score=182.41 GHRR01026293.1:162-1325(+)